MESQPLGVARGLLVEHAMECRLSALLYFARHDCSRARFARRNGATVNDVFLAAFGRALAEVMPSRLAEITAWRLGSIVDTRGLAEVDLNDTFGAFLAYYLVRLHSAKTIRLDEATRQIAAASAPIKGRASLYG